MANRVGQKVFPRGARRQSMLPVGTCTNLGIVGQVRSKTKRYAKHYRIEEYAHFTAEWFRRDEFTVEPCD